MAKLAGGARSRSQRDGNMIELRIRMSPRAHQVEFGSVRGGRGHSDEQFAKPG